MQLSDLEAEGAEEQSTPFYTSLSDLMVLLCVFFIMLVAMSKIDIGSFEKVRSGFSGSIANTLVELAADLEATVSGEPGIPGVTVGLDPDGVRLDLDTAALFPTGSAVLKPAALDPLRPLFEKILPTVYHIDIEGHSDDQPLYRMVDGELETNWSLSGRRASSVVQHLVEFGFEEERLRIVGYAATRPKTPVDGLLADDLEKARAKNRRVSLLVR